MPSAIWTVDADMARPIIAPAIELAEASSASGSARRRSASPIRSRLGPAASALASATSRPAPRTKSRWKGKKPPTMGTNSTPPPTPAGTATMPSRKQTTNSASGQTHQATVSTAAGVAPNAGGAQTASARTASGSDHRRASALARAAGAGKSGNEWMREASRNVRVGNRLVGVAREQARATRIYRDAGARRQ